MLRLKQIDIEFMRRLHTRVNLIPVLAKADTMTDEEVAEYKARVGYFASPTLVFLPEKKNGFLDSCRYRPS